MLRPQISRPFVEHCERAENTDDIAGAKFAASDKDSELRKKKRTKSKGNHGYT